MTKCILGEECDIKASHGDILEPLSLSASITRNISLPTKAFPNIDISLSLDAIKVPTSTLPGCSYKNALYRASA